MAIDTGPQYGPDPPFTARMRFHQSWYRATILGARYDRYGSVLDSAAGARGLNFLTPRIFEVARARIAQGPGVEPERCLHNMLSSQPMCFNLFGPLVGDLDLATRVMQAMLPSEVAEVTDVRIEYAPAPASEYLDDRTAFDAFIAYRDVGGAPAFLGIETKLTERFSEREYDGPTYRRFTECRPSLWREDAWPQLARSDWNQLWRNHLLVEALCRHPNAPHGRRGRVVLVRHPGDLAIDSVSAAYRSFLVAPDDTMGDWPLDVLARAWSTCAQSEAERRWLDAFTLRYVDLNASEEHWT